MSEPLYIGDLEIWESWERDARGRHGVSTLTILAIETAWRSAAANFEGETIARANEDPDGLVSIRPYGTNVRSIARVSPRNHFIILLIEPHPFAVDSRW